MTTRAKISLCATPIIITATVALSVTGLVYYHDSFLTSTRIGEWRRIPLDYPWHIVDYGQEHSGVKLEDWRVYTGEIETPKPKAVPMGVDLERETLQTLKYIGNFGCKNGILYGVRDIYSPPNSKGQAITPKWFILRLEENKPSYYDTKEEYQIHCKSFGIDAESTSPFSDQWEGFQKKVFQNSLITQVLSGLRSAIKP